MPEPEPAFHQHHRRHLNIHCCVVLLHPFEAIDHELASESIHPSIGSNSSLVRIKQERRHLSAPAGPYDTTTPSHHTIIIPTPGTRRNSSSSQLHFGFVLVPSFPNRSEPSCRISSSTRPTRSFLPSRRRKVSITIAGIRRALSFLESRASSVLRRRSFPPVFTSAASFTFPKKSRYSMLSRN
ncbi:hypothetical protein VTL71DRAFT_4708 [Oculimacula yallundae]|uniref:Uncharacterized protein n=1 Tax=Oculimacula yallundae TaxID=86028 RepID=A0ABR4C2S6_9HELO